MARRLALAGLVLVLVVAGVLLWRSHERTMDQTPPVAVSAPSTHLTETKRDVDAVPGRVAPERAVVTQTASTVPAAESVKQAATLRILVVTAEGQHPVQGIRVILRWADSRAGCRLDAIESVRGSMTTAPITGSHGRVEFEAPTGENLIVEALETDGGAGPAEKKIGPLAPGQDQEVVLRVKRQPDLAFCGQIVDAETKGPIAGARIDVREGAGGPGWIAAIEQGEHAEFDHQTPVTYATDERGRFSLKVASWRSSTASIVTDSYGPRVVALQGGHERSEDALVIELMRAATLRVRVRNGDGSPVPGAVLSLEAERFRLVVNQDASYWFTATSGLGTAHWDCGTDSSGTATITGLPDAVELRATLTREGKVLHAEPKPLELQVGEVRDLEWAVGAGCQILGSIADQHGVPVAKTTMWLMRAEFGPIPMMPTFSTEKARETETDGAGKFVFTDVPTGQWLVGPKPRERRTQSKDENAVVAAARFIDVSASDSDLRVEMQADRGLYISGRVVTPAGGPPPRASVDGSQENLLLFESVEADDNGVFALGPLIAGRYQVSATSGNDFAPSDPIDCGTGQTDVVLQLRAGGKISGVVIDPSNNHAVEAAITYAQADTTEFGMTTTGTASDGSYLIGGLVPGVYRVMASDSNGRVGLTPRITIAIGQVVTNSDITLGPAGHVRVRCVGAEKRRQVEIVANGVTVAVDQAETESVHEFTVPPGDITVRLDSANPDWTRGPIVTRAVTVAAGETKDVEIGKDGG